MINLETLVAECTSELASIGINYNSNYPIRWGRANKSCWAKTYTHKWNGEIYACEIDVNPVLKNATNIHEVKDTIIHEMLHTFPGCQCHTGEWKRLATIVNNRLHYEISRCGSYFDFGFSENPLATPDKYLIKCNGCGTEWRYKRNVSVVNSARNGKAHCTCGSRNFIVINL